jgi:hypothetical protein
MIRNDITYERPELNAKYDYVGIVDGLSETDRNKFQITEQLKNLFLDEGLTTVTALIHTAAQLFGALDIFYDKALAGERFMIHFVSHGNDDGIQVGDDFVTWSMMRPYLQKINVATDQTLLLNMSTCKGLHGVKIVDKDGDYPFFGLIGAKADLLVTDALKANKIMYRKWLNDMPVQKLVPETNQELGRDVLFNVSAEGFRKIKL